MRAQIALVIATGVAVIVLTGLAGAKANYEMWLGGSPLWFALLAVPAVLAALLLWGGLRAQRIADQRERPWRTIGGGR